MNQAITVVISVRNASDTIKKCIDSVLINSVKPKEVIVVDAYSDDGTYEILKKYGKKISLYQVPGSAPYAFNYALDRVKTDYVALTDADCVVDKNWLKELLHAVQEKGVIASAGYCGTPKKLSILPKVIGIELENRFKKFPKYITRAPTMNLLMKTDPARKVKFDTNLFVAFETDFGYRLMKYGKMKYTPTAKVLHYHRATWNGYFKQQKNYAINLPLLYIRHLNKSSGDHLSKPSMMVQPLLFSTVVLFLGLTFFNAVFFNPALLLFALLVLIYFKDLLSYELSLKEKIVLLLLFFVRTMAWSYGLFQGLIYATKKGWSKRPVLS